MFARGWTGFALLGLAGMARSDPERQSKEGLDRQAWTVRSALEMSRWARQDERGADRIRVEAIGKAGAE